MTATEVEKGRLGQKVRRLADGNGLFIEIKPTGVKWWRYRFCKPDTGKDIMLSWKRNHLLTMGALGEWWSSESSRALAKGGCPT